MINTSFSIRSFQHIAFSTQRMDFFIQLLLTAESGPLTAL